MAGYSVQRRLSDWWLRRAGPEPLPFPSKEGKEPVAENLNSVLSTSVAESKVVGVFVMECVDNSLPVHEMPRCCPLSALCAS